MTPFAKLKVRAEEIASKRVHVGVLATGAGAQRVEGSDISVVELAAIHEFGSPAAGIPERSFIRSTLQVHEREALRHKTAELCRAVILGAMSVDQALNLLGVWATAAIRRSITTGKITPPLKQATIDRKGSSRPLVDTGQLINSITHEVVAAGKDGGL